jgi:hypothetical protein
MLRGVNFASAGAAEILDATGLIKWVKYNFILFLFLIHIFHTLTIFIKFVPFNQMGHVKINIYDLVRMA